EYGKIIPAVMFERLYRNILPRYVELLTKQLNLAPLFLVEAGAVGIEDFRLAVDDLNIYGPIYDDSFGHQYDLKAASRQEIDKVLLAFFEDFFGATGYPRPPNLDGFGPKTS